MEDYFGRKLEIGDTIVWMQYDVKMYTTAKIIGFGKQFGKPYAQTQYRARVQTGFIILEKANGQKFTWG